MRAALAVSAFLRIRNNSFGIPKQCANISKKTKALHVTDNCLGIVSLMIVHIVPMRDGDEPVPITGFCGAPIEGLYVRQSREHSAVAPHLCPVCKASEAPETLTSSEPA